MPLEILTETEVSRPPIWAKMLSDFTGGGELITDDIPSDIKIIYEGTPVVVSASTAGIWNITKNAKSTSTQAAATSNTVAGPSLFKVGEFIGKYGSGTSSTITIITRTAAGTDTIVTTAALSTLATLSVLVRTASAATATVTAKYSPTGLLRGTVKVRNSDLSTINNVDIAIATRADVIEDALYYPVSAGDKTALGLFTWV